MPRASGATAYQKVWGTEMFMSPSHWCGSFNHYDSTEVTNLTAWREASWWATEYDGGLGAHPTYTVGNNYSRAALDIHSAAAGFTWYGFSALRSSVNGGERKIIPGPRCLGFYLLTASSTPRVVLELVLRNQFGETVTERKTLTIRTHSSVSSGSMVPVNEGGFYNPHSVSLGGVGSATWCSLPVTREMQTNNAACELMSIKLVSKHSTTANDRILVHGKTLRFGLRNEINEVDDIIGGWVESYPVVPVTDESAGLFPYWVLGVTGPLSGVGPFVSPLKLEYASVNEEYNLLELDNTVGGRNGHTIRDLDPNFWWIENHGEMLMYTNQAWRLCVDVRPH